MNTVVPVVLRLECKFCGEKHAVTVLPASVGDVATVWMLRHAPCPGDKDSRLDCDAAAAKDGPFQPILTAVLRPKGVS